VDLPAPLGPKSPRISPSPTEKEALKMDIREEIRKSLIVLSKTIKNLSRKTR